MARKRWWVLGLQQVRDPAQLTLLKMLMLPLTGASGTDPSSHE